MSTRFASSTKAPATPATSLPNGSAAGAERAPRRPQFRREDRQEFRYLLAIFVARTASRLVWLMPIWFRGWLANRGGDAYYRLFKTYRGNVAANLRYALGPEASDAEIDAVSRTVFRMSGRNFADVLIGPHVSPQALADAMTTTPEDLARLDAALAQGKGAILITAHLGAFDSIGHALLGLGYKVTTVTGRTTARFLFDAVTHLRRAHGVGIVEATPSGVRRVIQALRRGECAGFITDRDFFQNGKPVVFFGHETTLPPGPVRIARDTGAPIVPLIARRTADGYGLAVGEPFGVERTNDLEADLERGLERVVAFLEAAIRAAPDQWVMFQQVWPTAPADPVRVFPVGSPLESELLQRVDALLPAPRAPRSAPMADGAAIDPAVAPTGRTATPPRSPA